MEFIFVINISAEEPSAKKDLYFLVWEWEGKAACVKYFLECSTLDVVALPI
jgi:hypothetical protein